jgi:serine/threonine protein kinase
VAYLEGQALGHYRLLRLIGHGGVGEVYLAENEQHVEDHVSRQVAIKVVRISDTTLSTDLTPSSSSAKGAS